MKDEILTKNFFRFALFGRFSRDFQFLTFIPAFSKQKEEETNVAFLFPSLSLSFTCAPCNVIQLLHEFFFMISFVWFLFLQRIV